MLTCSSVILIMTSCLGHTTLKSEQPSPKGKYLAELSESDTGAVGGWMSAVRLSEVNPTTWDRMSRREAATVFGGDFRSGCVTLVWKTENQLNVAFSGCDASKIELQKRAWRDVTISYDIGGSR